MDIEVLGIKFSNFISAFKEAYRLTDTTYDYMSYLKVVDCASYCSLMEQYNNPNDVLNLFITPQLDSIDIVGGGRKNKNMKGGQGMVFVLVLLLFSRALANLYQGPAYEEILRKYGNDPAAWPKEPGSQPQYPKGWDLFFFTLNPSQKSIDEYNQALKTWNNRNTDYQNYQRLYSEYSKEFQQLVNIDTTRAQTSQIRAQSLLSVAQTDLTTAQTAQDSQKANQMLMYEFIELAKQNSIQQKELGWLYGLLTGIGSTLGLVGIIIGYMYTRMNPRNMTPIQQGPYSSSVRVEEVPEQYPQITNPQLQLGYQSDSLTRRRGGKTKNYKKKRTTRRRR